MTAPAPVLHLDDPGLADALERNQWEFIRGFAVVPGVEVVDDERTLRVATGVPSPLFNPVLRTTVEPAEIGEVVAEARAWYRERRLPWSWYVGPASEPPDLERELARRGFTKVTEPPGMAADLATLDELEAGAPVRIERVSQRRQIESWFAVFAPAFELSRSAATAFRDLILAGGLGDDAPMLNYVAYEQRTPVATGVRAWLEGRARSIASQCNRYCAPTLVKPASAVFSASSLGVQHQIVSVVVRCAAFAPAAKTKSGAIAATATATRPTRRRARLPSICCARWEAASASNCACPLTSGRVVNVPAACNAGNSRSALRWSSRSRSAS